MSMFVGIVIGVLLTHLSITRRVVRYVRLWLYCFAMSHIWNWSYSLYNWAEDRRPGGGFRVDYYIRR